MKKKKKKEKKRNEMNKASFVTQLTDSVFTFEVLDHYAHCLQ